MKPTLNDIDGYIKAEAKVHGLDWLLVKAIAMTESSLNPCAMRYEARWKWWLDPKKWAWKLKIMPVTERIAQASSWGLMQVMGTVARELGLEDHIPILIYPQVGLKYGCLKLKSLLEKHGDIDAAVAAYNAGSPRRNGFNEFLNQDYVDKVLGTYEKLKRNQKVS